MSKLNSQPSESYSIPMLNPSKRLQKLNEQIEALEARIDRLDSGCRQMGTKAANRVKRHEIGKQLKELRRRLDKLYEMQEHEEKSQPCLLDDMHETTTMSQTAGPSQECLSLDNIQITQPKILSPEALLANALSELECVDKKRRSARSIWASKEEKLSLLHLNAQYAFLQFDIAKLRKQVAERSLTKWS